MIFLLLFIGTGLYIASNVAYVQERRPKVSTPATKLRPGTLDPRDDIGFTNQVEAKEATNWLPYLLLLLLL